MSSTTINFQEKMEKPDREKLKMERKLWEAQKKLSEAENKLIGCTVAIIVLAVFFLVALACAIAYGVKFSNCEGGRP